VQVAEDDVRFALGNAYVIDDGDAETVRVAIAPASRILRTPPASATFGSTESSTASFLVT